MRRLVLETKQVVNDAETTYRLFETDGASKEIFVDGVHGATLTGTIVKLNFFTRGAGSAARPGQVEERDVACRIVLGSDTFSQVVQLLNRIEADLKRQRAEHQDAVKKA